MSDHNNSGEQSIKKQRSKHAQSIIKNHLIWSMGAGFIPIPIADIVAVTAIQLDMIRQIAKVYDIDYKETEGKAIITTLTGSSLASIGARAVKFIPGVGTLLGGATMSILSGASTYALGEVFKKHFQTGGTFLDFDPQRFKKYYQEKFEKGKKVAKEVKDEVENENKDENSEESLSKTEKIQNMLKELVDLKTAGVISELEYEKLKSNILKDI